MGVTISCAFRCSSKKKESEKIDAALGHLKADPAFEAVEVRAEIERYAFDFRHLATVGVPWRIRQLEHAADRTFRDEFPRRVTV